MTVSDKQVIDRLAHAFGSSSARESDDALHGRLAGLARETRTATVSGDEALAAAYLVPADRMSDVRAAVDAFGDQHPDLTLVCTGPWAPFSFSESA
jgi:hypothetical protein